jgi:hypothetical protein
MADLKRAKLRRKWSTIPKEQHFTISRHASPHGGFLFPLRCLFELAHVLVRLDHFVIARWRAKEAESTA